MRSDWASRLLRQEHSLLVAHVLRPIYGCIPHYSRQMDFKPKANEPYHPWSGRATNGRCRFDAYLIWRGTGFDIYQFSPKLIAKIVVVTILTVNAVAIGQLALPYFERNTGVTFGQFSLAVRLRLAGCGAVSSAS